MIDRSSDTGVALAKQQKIVIGLLAVSFASVTSALLLNGFLLAFGQPWQLSTLDNVRTEVLTFALFDALVLKFKPRKATLVKLALVGSLWLFLLPATGPGMSPLHFLRGVIALVAWPFLNLFLVDTALAMLRRLPSPD